MITRILIVLITASIASCGEYLDLKPDNRMVIPATLYDLQALLNNTGFLNMAEEAIGEMSADNYFLDNEAINAVDEGSRLIYIWDKEASSGGAGWPSYYRIILYANQILESINVVSGEKNEKDVLRGKALFFRANAYYQLAQLFTAAYDKPSASDKPGLPLRLTPGISLQSERATLQQTYEQMLEDFTAASELLPPSVIETPTQPNRAASYAGLARVYLLMGEYSKALEAAESSLLVYNNLVDYNSLSLADANPVHIFNEETIFYSQYGGATLLQNNICNVDTVLYGLYREHDLRKDALFEVRNDGTIRFRGNYAGNDSQGIFNGITTAELFLIKAECLVRLGNLSKAGTTLDSLLVYRYRTDNLEPSHLVDMSSALLLIIEERRKELLFRGTRWTDLKRLNLGTMTKSIYRNVGGERYELPANDDRYVFRIPDDVINATGMPQNER